MDEKVLEWTWLAARQISIVLWECYSPWEEILLSLKIKAYWYEITLDQRCAGEEATTAWKDPHWGKWSTYVDEDSTKEKVQILSIGCRNNGALQIVVEPRLVYIKNLSKFWWFNKNNWNS